MAYQGVSTRAIRKRNMKEEPTKLSDELLEENPDSIIVSESVRLSCAVCIPEESCPTSHAEFLKEYSTTSETLTKSEVDKIQELTGKKKVHKKSKSKCTSPASKGSSPVSDASPKKENSPKQKNKRKFWFEDETPIVNIIGRNKLEINGKVVFINYTKYTKGDDIVIHYEVDEINQRPLPGYEKSCKQDFCRLGCVCGSIAESGIERKRCEFTKCMFGCLCYSNKNEENDGDIRSRLRPRASLYTQWKDPCLNEKLVNSKQLEKRNSTTPLKGKRTTQLPSRFNETAGKGNQNVQNHSAGSKKGCKNNEPRSPGQIKKYGRAKKKRDASPHPQQSIPEIMVVANDYNINGAENSILGDQTAKIGELRYEEEFPTLLYQPIGTNHDVEDTEYLESSNKAINSYGNIKRLLKQFPLTELLQRKNGKYVIVSWTTSELSPKILEKTTAGDHLMLPILPEKSEWLIYELPENYEKSSYIGFTNIGFVVSTKILIFQKITANNNNRVVKLRLSHHENRNALSTVSLFLLPKYTNLVVLGPVKQNICNSRNFTIRQTLSYVESIDGQNYFGSKHLWDFESGNNQERLAEPFDVYLQRKRKEDSHVLTNKTVPPEVMVEIFQDLMETYEPEDVPKSLQPLIQGKRNVIELKWSDSKRCSANFHPEVQTLQNAIPVHQLEDDSPLIETSIN